MVAIQSTSTKHDESYKSLKSNANIRGGLRRQFLFRYPPCGERAPQWGAIAPQRPATLDPFLNVFPIRVVSTLIRKTIKNMRRFAALVCLVLRRGSDACLWGALRGGFSPPQGG
jgi:hypothetical protein